MRRLLFSRPDRLLLGETSVSLPGFIPAITGTHPLDRMIAPHLLRVSPLGQLLSYPSFFIYHGQPAPVLPRTWIDGGSWGVLRRGGTWRRRPDGTAVVDLVYPRDRVITVTPEELLETQEKHAAAGFTLDIPVPPDCPWDEAHARLQASVENARFAAHARNRRCPLLLYASLPAVGNADELLRALDEVLALPVDGVALGGMALRRRDWRLCLDLVARVRRRAGRLPLHVFGIGELERVRQVWEAGADTVDSSSPLRMALEGRLAGSPGLGIPAPSPVERLHAALVNIAQFAALPLSADLASFVVSTPVVRLAQPIKTARGEGIDPYEIGAGMEEPS